MFQKLNRRMLRAARANNTIILCSLLSRKLRLAQKAAKASKPVGAIGSPFGNPPVVRKGKR